MTKHGSVSIVLCTYNGEKYLTEQLESYRSQTYCPSELVVCDDASEDDTMSILQRYQRKTSFPVRIYKNSVRLGYQRNFEKCASVAKGEFVAFSDQDDIWLPKKLEACISPLQKYDDCGFSWTDSLLIDCNGTFLQTTVWEVNGFRKRGLDLFRNGRGIEVVFSGSVIQGAALLVRRSFFRETLPFQSGWSHDEWITFNLQARGHFGIPIDIPLMLYRQHSGQTVGTCYSGNGWNSSGPNHAYIERTKTKIDILQQYNSVDSIKIKSYRKFHAHLVFRWETRCKSLVQSVYPVIIEILRLNYLRFSEGLSDVLADLFIKCGEEEVER